jgi:TonB family protein
MINYRLTAALAAGLIVAITVSNVFGSPMHITPAQAARWALSTPKPEYPKSARIRRATGSGYFKLRVRIKTGRVKEITILRSTGNKTLDTAAIQAFALWRFKTGVLPSIRSGKSDTKDPFADEDCLILVPLTFTSP